MKSQFESVVKEAFPKVLSMTTRRRGAKLYLKVKLSEYFSGSYQYLLDIKAALTCYFPKIYMTSGGGTEATYRLNA